MGRFTVICKHCQQPIWFTNGDWAHQERGSWFYSCSYGDSNQRTSNYGTQAEPDWNSVMEIVHTGQPMAQFVGCRECGVLLWDIEKHWLNAHQVTHITG